MLCSTLRPEDRCLNHLISIAKQKGRIWGSGKKIHQSMMPNCAKIVPIRLSKQQNICAKMAPNTTNNMNFVYSEGS